MSEEKNQIAENPPETNLPKIRRNFFSRRKILWSLGAIFFLFLIGFIVLFIAHRSGYIDQSIKTRLEKQFSEYGVKAEISKLNTTLSPISAELSDVQFFDEITGEKLAKVDRLNVGMTIPDLFALQSTRNVNVDSTDVEGLEVWVKFDANGKSNFSNLKLKTDEKDSNLKFSVASLKFNLKDAIVHYGDTTRKLSGTARNITTFLEPENPNSPENERRYKFDFGAKSSEFTYDDKKIEPIDISASGIADQNGADVTNFKLITPLGESNLSGKIENWQNPAYDLKIKSSVDLTQTAGILANGTALDGVGDFEGTVKGIGEKYTVEGEIFSKSLAADNVRLKGFTLNGTFDGEGDSYKANGKAVADMLTAGDFQLNLIQLMGNVYGTGTDFRWLGELRAAAAKTPNGTLGDLFLKDAYAEYQDKKFYSTIGGIVAREFESVEAKISGLNAGKTKIYSFAGQNSIEMVSLSADSVSSKSASLNNLNASGVKISNRGSKTDINIGRVNASNLSTKDAQLKNVSGNDVLINQNGSDVDISAKNVQSDGIDSNGTKIGRLNAGQVNAKIRGNQTEVQARNVKTDNLDVRGAKSDGIEADSVNAKINGNETDLEAKNVRSKALESGDAKLNDISADSVNAVIKGNTTSVDANDLRIGGISASGATIGEMNVAGARLRIVEENIEGETDDVKAESVTLAKNKDLPEGGKFDDVTIKKPVFLLEKSGRYRATFDLSLGGGILGKVKIGQANASIVASNEKIELTKLNAKVLDGEVNGNATVSLVKNVLSHVDTTFTGLDLAKIVALQGGKVIPVAGKTNGKINLSFPDSNVKQASGTLTADFLAKAGNEQNGLVPLDGKLGLKATNGLFDIDYANFKTDQSEFNAKGRFDLDGNDSNLEIALNSSDAKETQRLIKALGVAPELDEQLATANAELNGQLTFNGTVRGNIYDPTIDGRSYLEFLVVNKRNLGSVASNISVGKNEIKITDGVLSESNGGNANFNVTVPKTGSNNITLAASLDRINTGNLFQVLPLDNYVPKNLQDLKTETSGTINLTGLPNEIVGTADLNSGKGTIAGEAFDGFTARLDFQNTLVKIEKLEAKFADGIFSAVGNYDGDSTVFNLEITGKNLQVARVQKILYGASGSAQFAGNVDLTAKATGEVLDYSTYVVNLKGIGREIKVNDSLLGNLVFETVTANKQINANLTAQINGQEQLVTANLDLTKDSLPLRVETNFKQTPLAPFAALFRPPESVPIEGTATGNVFFGGDLGKKDADGKTSITFDQLKGTADFSEFGLQIRDTPFIATEPLALRFSTSEVVVDNAKFASSGSNLVVSGTKAFNDNGINNLALDGKLNLRVLDGFARNTFYGGLADVAIRLTGVNKDSRLSGSARTENASISTFVSNQRLNFDRIKCRVLFNADQAQIESCVGNLGGGKVVATGGALLADLIPQKFRLDLRGIDVTAPLPRNYRTTADAEIEISGERTETGDYSTLISGRIRGKQSFYTEDIDLADVIRTRREGSISEGNDKPLLGIPQLDLQIEGRDALFVKNNLADLVASVSLRVTGDVDYPLVIGRVTATSGTLFFRNDRYEIRRGFLDFPPRREDDITVSLQGESEIKGYQVFADVNGSLSNLDELAITLRSNPSLPQTDVVSLVTTGNLSNTDTGIPTLAQSGLNTAANILTDSLINNPTRKATDKLFGLNRFEIDPILSGKRLTPSARLTVGRQINKNLAVTYSTNLAQERNQVVAIEYRVSNRLSFVAQYEQDALGNVTRSNNNFSFEIRLRKRF